ncbi:hypothetical protein [Streptomyces katrae]|uniref:hypothetical protein n=1 Tax=Streptomyces katrae TaxID=68223 RepID=UPI0009A547DE|nr:hypothetical protein [Streptomyces katrae]
MITTEPVGEWFWEPSPVLDAEPPSGRACRGCCGSGRPCGALEALEGCLGRTGDGASVGAVVHEAASLDALEDLSGRY